MLLCRLFGSENARIIVVVSTIATRDGRGPTSRAVADLRGDGSTEALVANYATGEVAGLIGCLQTSKDGRCDLYSGTAS